MRNLNKTLIEYLSAETDYAVQIVGAWGYGKTYFYRNNLEPLICSTPTATDASKKYKPIYISLFGLKSVEDIATKIVLEFYQSKWFKNYYKSKDLSKRLKITQSVLRIGLRGFLTVAKFGNPSEHLTDVKNAGENALNTNELLICFDDLERKDSTFDIQDLTGYINSLVDEKIKVLIISNEDLLLKEKEYGNLKEKIIGISIEYKPDVTKTLQSIIDSRYSGFPAFNRYLYDNINLLLRFVTSVNFNFRHVIYALGNLHSFYSKIKAEIFDTKHEITSVLEQELNKITFMVLLFSAEYKSSKLKYSDIETYRNQFKSLTDTFAAAESKAFAEAHKNIPYDDLLNKYDLQNADFVFFESIYSYATANDELNVEQFIKEFARRFNLEKGQIAPQYELLNELGYMTCFDLTDQKYRDKTNQMLQYAYKGLYYAADYFTVMHFSERFDNVSELDLQAVLIKLMDGLEKAICNDQTNNELSFSQFEVSGYSEELSPASREMHRYGLHQIQLLRQNKAKQEMQKSVNLLITDVDAFREKYKSDRQFKSALFEYPFLEIITPQVMFDNLLQMPNNAIWFFKHFLIDIYKNSEKLRKEKSLLGDFHEKLGSLYQEFEGKEKKLRNYLLANLLSSVKEILLQAL